MTNTALLTGSYGGLGTCLARIHAEHGGDLILVGRNSEKLTKQAEELRQEYDVTVKTIAADLAKPEAAQKSTTLAAKMAGQLITLSTMRVLAVKEISRVNVRWLKTWP